MKTLKILLVGVGGYGSNYIKELQERRIAEVKIEGICDIQEHLEDEYPIIMKQKIPIYKNLESFYNNHSADLAIISTPIHLHDAQITTCIQYGSNVLCEKPICSTLEGTQKLMELEKVSGKFIGVGYQLNFSKDVIALKQDILDGKYGKPIKMKALHAMRRGSKYYARNNWAGRINVNSVSVNDSPFNNACAHQYQNMTFLLGNNMKNAMDIKSVEAQVFRANRNVENFDTVALCAYTKNNVPIYYYTSHAIQSQKLGPISEYQFENGTIYYGKDFGNGPVMEYVGIMKDGEIINYGRIAKGERLQKMYDAIACVHNKQVPNCTIRCAIPHLQTVVELSHFPIRNVDSKWLEFYSEDDEQFVKISMLEEIFLECYQNEHLITISDFL